MTETSEKSTEPRRDGAPKEVESKREWRYDHATLMEPVRRADGTLLCEAVVSAPCVLTYRDAKGNTWRELVPPETLKDPDYIRSCAHAPVTLQHPEQDVTPDNVKEHAVGNTDGYVTLLENGFVRCHMIVRERKALDAIDAGVREVSPGYQVVIERTPGVHPQFGRYDAIQRKRVINHIAIVEQGRSGPQVALRADSAVQVLSDTPIKKKVINMDPEEFKKMLTQLFPQLLEGALAPFRADMDALKKDMLNFKGGGAAAGASAAGQEQNKGSQQPAQTEQQRADELNKLAAERAELLPLAAEHKIDASKFPDTKALRKEIACKLKPTVRKDEADDYYRRILDEQLETARLDEAAPADAYDTWRREQTRADSARHNGGDRTLSNRDAMCAAMRGDRART